MNIKDKKILSFDCYGTLIDWETGIIKALQQLDSSSLQGYQEDQLLEMFASNEHLIEAKHPHLKYQQILYLVAKQVSEQLFIKPDDWKLVEFSRSVLEWTPFADTVEALAKLRDHFQLVILSNIDNEAIAAASLKMGNPFYKIITAEEVGAYKPSHIMFDHLFTTLQNDGIEKHNILHVAQSLFHDHVPAYELGLDSVWINRRHGKEGEGASVEVDKKYTPSLQFKSMEEFVEYALK